MTDIHLRDSEPKNISPRVKQAPRNSAIPVPFFYAASDDGTDENLLILLHGLGDTHIPFSKLGRQLKLPQTAILALRAPEQVPFLYEESYQWYPSFDDLGETIENPNPTIALDLLSRTLNHLINDCTWSPNRIHFFGFAQGGSVATEFGVKWWKSQLQAHKAALPPPSHGSGEGGNKSPVLPSNSLSFGSIISISGPFLSYPTVSSPCPTPVLICYRPPPAEPTLTASALASFRKGFQTVKESKMKASGPGMPASKAEWEPIMKFWSETLARRQVEGLYEVMTGSRSS